MVTPVSCDFSTPYTRQCETEAPPGTVDSQMLIVSQLNTLSSADTGVFPTAERASSGDPQPEAIIVSFPAVRDAIDTEQPSEETSMSDVAPDRLSILDQLQEDCIPRSQDLAPDDLDRLFDSLQGSLQTNATDSASQFHVWPSIRIIETTQADDSATWSPLRCSISSSAARYHILPYFARFHWQLAMFDQNEQVIARYDSAWPDGTDRFTFTVLQRWLDSNGGNPRQDPYEYTMVKVSPLSP